MSAGADSKADSNRVMGAVVSGVLEGAAMRAGSSKRCGGGGGTGGGGEWGGSDSAVAPAFDVRVLQPAGHGPPVQP